MTGAAPVVLWLPALDRLEPAHPLRRWRGRADRLPDGPAQTLDVLGGWFDCDTPDTGAALPAAALMREFLHGDAGDAVWLMAEPAWVQPEMNGVRLLGYGAMQLEDAGREALAAAITPAFDDAGLALLPAPPGWHVRVPDHLPVPPFVAPEQALGEDLLQHLPQGSEGRPWRVLLNEVQVLLHQHPLQAQRRARGLAPVNSLWLWGAGRRPRQVRTALAGVAADDTLLCALAACAGIDRQPLDALVRAPLAAGWLIDLRGQTEAWLANQGPWLEALLRRHPVLLCLPGGQRWLSRPRYRWRFWRGGGA